MGGPGSGRTRRPTNLTGIDGGKAPRRRNVAPGVEPQPKDGAVRMPTGMTARAVREWKALAPDLIAKKVLTAWDVTAFRAYCEAVSLAEQTRALVAEQGTTVRGSTGSMVVNPNLRIMHDAEEQAHRFGAKFGLNPAARAAMSVEATDRKDGIEKFL